MNALTWTRSLLSHRHHNQAAATVTTARRRGRWEILAAVAIAYGLVLLGLLVAARTAFGMSDDMAWGFAIGVASYVLLFTGFICGLAWCVVTNRMDDPNRC